MGRQRHTAEQIVAKLREAEVLLGKGMSMEEVLRQLAISDATYYKWRKEYNTIRPHSSLGYRAPAPEAYALRQVANA